MSAKPKTITIVYLFKDTVSMSLPAQIIVTALRTVAIEYKLPNSVLDKLNVCLKSLLKREIKNVCPNPDEKAIKKPKNSRCIFL